MTAERCEYAGCLGPADGSECRHPEPDTLDCGCTEDEAEHTAGCDRNHYPHDACEESATMTNPTTTAEAIRAAVNAAAPEMPVTVEQTGGGTATVYVGTFGQDGRAWASIGPGGYDYSSPWQSTFYLEELSIGRDDNGESPSTYIETLAEITAYVANRIADERNDR